MFRVALLALLLAPPAFAGCGAWLAGWRTPKVDVGRYRWHISPELPSVQMALRGLSRRVVLDLHALPRGTEVFPLGFHYLVGPRRLSHFLGVQPLSEHDDRALEAAEVRGPNPHETEYVTIRVGHEFFSFPLVHGEAESMGIFSLKGAMHLLLGGDNPWMQYQHAIAQITKEKGHIDEVISSHVHPMLELIFQSETEQRMIVAPLSDADHTLAAYRSRCVPSGVLFTARAILPNGYAYTVTYRNGEMVPIDPRWPEAERTF